MNTTIMDEQQFPVIPSDQKRFTAGDTCKLCLIEHHTLRYWEKTFTKLVKATVINNRRYYTTSDIFTLREISKLKQQGLTTQGVIQRLSQGSEASNNNEVSDKNDLATLLQEGTKLRQQLQNVIDILT